MLFSASSCRSSSRLRSSRSPTSRITSAIRRWPSGWSKGEAEVSTQRQLAVAVSRPEGHALGSAAAAPARSRAAPPPPGPRDAPARAGRRLRAPAGSKPNRFRKLGLAYRMRPSGGDLADRIARALRESAEALVGGGAGFLRAQAAQRGREDLGDQLEARDVLIAPVLFGPGGRRRRGSRPRGRRASPESRGRSGPRCARSCAARAPPPAAARRCASARILRPLSISPRDHSVVVHRLFEAAEPGAPRDSLGAPLEDAAEARALRRGRRRTARGRRRRSRRRPAAPRGSPLRSRRRRARGSGARARRCAAPRAAAPRSACATAIFSVTSRSTRTARRSPDGVRYGRPASSTQRQPPVAVREPEDELRGALLRHRLRADRLDRARGRPGGSARGRACR